MSMYTCVYTYIASVVGIQRNLRLSWQNKSRAEATLWLTRVHSTEATYVCVRVCVCMSDRLIKGAHAYAHEAAEEKGRQLPKQRGSYPLQSDTFVLSCVQ